MGCQHRLAYCVSVFGLIVGVHRKIAYQISHGVQPLRVDAVLRFFYAKQTSRPWVFGQYGESKKAQGSVRYRTCRKLLTVPFGDRQRKELAGLVTNHIDMGNGYEFGQS